METGESYLGTKRYLLAMLRLDEVGVHVLMVQSICLALLLSPNEISSSKATAEKAQSPHLGIYLASMTAKGAQV